MNLTRLALDRDRVSMVTAVLLLLGGLLAFVGLPKAEDPGFTLRQVVVRTAFPGATPRRVEELVSAPLEEALQVVPEIAEIKSVSRAGLSVVTVKLDDAVTDLDPVLTDVRTRVEDAIPSLPSGALPPEVDTDVARVFGITLAVTGPDFDHREVVEAAKDLGDRMLTLEDTARVEYVGVQDREVRVAYDHAALAASGLSPQGLVGVLQQSNLTMPGGSMELGGQRVSVEPTGAFTQAEHVRELPVGLPTGSVVRMGDLVDVQATLVDPAQPEAFVEGRPAVLVGISQQEGGDARAWGRAVRQAVVDFERTQPIGIEVHELAFLPDDVQTRIRGFTSSLLQAVVIVFVVMLVFLGLRIGTVVAATIPLVVLATFLLMQLFGVGIDQMSLAGLLITLGMLVDNAIVVAEATQVRVAEGQSPRDAVIDAAAELRIPLLVSSLTTIVAFLPIALAEGAASEFVAPIFAVVTMALLASWAVALTLLPVLLVAFVRPGDTHDEGTHDGRFFRVYRGVLRRAMRHPWVTSGAALLGLVSAGLLFRSVPVDFFPPSEMPAFTLDVELPTSTSEAAGREAMARVAALLEAEAMVGPGRPRGVVTWGGVRGDALPRFKLTYKGPPRAPGSLAFLLRTTDRDVIESLGPTLERRLGAVLPGARVRARPLVVGPGEGADVGVRIAAASEEALFEAVEGATAHLRSMDGVQDVTDDWGPREQKLAVAIDPVRLRLAGVTHQDVGTALRSALAGIDATELYDGDEAATVRVANRTSIARDVEALRALTVAGARGPIPLDQVATLQRVGDFGRILRDQRRRAVTVEADVADGDAAGIEVTLASWVEGRYPTVSVERAGSSESSGRATRNLLAKAPLAAGIIALLLVVQFNSIRRMAVNLAVLPFAVTGVVVALLLLGSSFGFIALLGLISLFGILLNNGIVLIDRIDTELAAGRVPVEAVVEGSVQRVRPILLTTATTVLGLLPLYFGGGPTFEPLSVVLMGGLTLGTVVTLVLVPVFYAVVFRVR